MLETKHIFNYLVCKLTKPVLRLALHLFIWLGLLLFIFRISAGSYGVKQ